MRPSEKLPLVALGLLLILYMLAYSVWVFMQVPEIKNKVDNAELYTGLLAALTASIALFVPLIARKRIKNVVQTQNKLTTSWDIASPCPAVNRALLKQRTAHQKIISEKQNLKIIHGAGWYLEASISMLLQQAAHDGYATIRTTLKEIQDANGRLEKIWIERGQISQWDLGLPREHQLYFALRVDRLEWNILKSNKHWISEFLAEWPNSKLVIALYADSEIKPTDQKSYRLSPGQKKVLDLINSFEEKEKAKQKNQKAISISLHDLPAALFGLKVYPMAVVRPIKKIGWAIFWVGSISSIVLASFGNIYGMTTIQDIALYAAQTFILTVAAFSAIYALTSQVHPFLHPLSNQLLQISCSLIIGHFLETLFFGNWLAWTAMIYTSMLIFRLLSATKDARGKRRISQISFQICVLVGVWMVLCPPKLDTSDWAIWSGVLVAWSLVCLSDTFQPPRYWLIIQTLMLIAVVVTGYATNSYWDVLTRAQELETAFHTNFEELGIWEWEWIMFISAAFILLIAVLRGTDPRVCPDMDKDIQFKSLMYSSLLLVIANFSYILRISDSRIASFWEDIRDNAWFSANFNVTSMSVAIFSLFVCMHSFYLHWKFENNSGKNRSAVICTLIGFLSTYLVISKFHYNVTLDSEIVLFYLAQIFVVFGVAVAVLGTGKIPNSSFKSDTLNLVSAVLYGFIVSIFAVFLIIFTHWALAYEIANYYCASLGLDQCEISRLQFAFDRTITSYNESPYYIPSWLLGAICSLTFIILIKNMYVKGNSKFLPSRLRGFIGGIALSRPARLVFLLFLVLLFFRKMQEGQIWDIYAWSDLLVIGLSVLATGGLLLLIYLRFSSNFHPFAVGIVIFTFLWLESPAYIALSFCLAIAGGPSVYIYRRFQRPDMKSIFVAFGSIILFLLSQLSPAFREHTAIVFAVERVDPFDAVGLLVVVVMFFLLLITKPYAGGAYVWSESRRQSGAFRKLSFWVLTYLVLLFTSSLIATFVTGDVASLLALFDSFTSLLAGDFLLLAEEFLITYGVLMFIAIAIYLYILLWGTGGWYILEASSVVVSESASVDNYFCQSIRSLAAMDFVDISDWEVRGVAQR